MLSFIFIFLFELVALCNNFAFLFFYAFANMPVLLNCRMFGILDWLKETSVQDRAYCTLTQYSTLESRRKPLVLKELRYLWGGNWCHLPYYDETNTVLLDDSPYKALRNPVSANLNSIVPQLSIGTFDTILILLFFGWSVSQPYTAIFPEPYTYRHRRDRALGKMPLTYEEVAFLITWPMIVCIHLFYSRFIFDWFKKQFAAIHLQCSLLFRSRF